MRSGALLLVPLLLVAGCGGTDAGGAASADPSGAGPTSSPTASPTASPTSTPSVSPSEGPTSEGAQAADPGPARLPGGSAGRRVLARDWLDRAGRLTDGRRAPTAGVQRAICAYLFGTPAQVGRVARLPGTVTLAPRSGYAGLGSDGVGFQCGYDVGGTTAYSLAVWSKRLDASSGQAAHLVEEPVARGRYGYSAYAPTHVGAAEADTTARRWLRQAGDRVSPAVG